MTETMTKTDRVKVSAYFTDPGVFASESLWAEQVQTAENGGAYRVANIPFFLDGVNEGDVVAAEFDVDGVLTLTHVVSRSGNSTVRVLFGDNVAEQEARAQAKAWQETGVGVEGMSPKLFVLSLPADGTVTIEDIEAVEELEVVEVASRGDDDLGPVEGILPPATESRIELTHTTYRAGADPYWAEFPGEYVASVQRLAETDQRVANALENGRYEQVVTFVDRLARSAAGLPLEPLDGPIFTD